MKKILEDCYDESVKLLIENSTKYGILAGGKTKKATERNYLSIFGRDASICSLGMVASGNEKLIRSAYNSLVTLAKFQASNGQIPFFVKPEKKEVDFYYLGCIDSTLWWLIAIKYFDKHLKKNIEKRLQKNIALALQWLQAQEHPKFYLVQQNEASDWADLMPRSGFVLYTNALWYKVKKLYGLQDAGKTKEYFNYIFDAEQPLKGSAKKDTHLKRLRSYINNKSALYSSFVNYSFYGDEEDVYANILSCLADLPNRKAKSKIASYLSGKKISYPFPVTTVLNPIKQTDKKWRKYMERHSSINKPYGYHNGGIWPYIGCFWVLLLNQVDKNLAVNELEKVALACKKNNWQFNEWFHGKNGKPMGVHRQSWNAAMFILSSEVLRNSGKKF